MNAQFVNIKKQYSTARRNVKDRIKTEKASAEDNEGNIFDNVF